MERCTSRSKAGTREAVYVALEGGHSGSGHGHPDRLALSLQIGAERWLQDPGTGSYVERTLHWYRSTLAHHAPLVSGASQPPATATLLAYEERGGMGWMRKRATIGQGVEATRTIVVCEGYCIDVLEWERDAALHALTDDITITLPLCGDAHRVTPEEFAPALRTGAGGLEDGFDFLQQVESVRVEGTAVIDAVALSATGTPSVRAGAQLMLTANVPATLIKARVPGAPGCSETMRHAVELRGPSGRMVSVWHWVPSDALPVVERIVLNAIDESAPLARVTSTDGTTAVHGPATHGWHIELLARHARSSVDLEGLVEGPPVIASADVDHVASRGPALAMPLRVMLEESHYLCTEQSWAESGSPTATVQIAADGPRVVVEVVANTGVVVSPDGAENPLDNERAQVNADGVQWYWGSSPAGWAQAALCTPTEGAVLMTRLVPGEWPLPYATWTALPDGGGWRARFEWRLADLPVEEDGTIAFELVVNERPPERVRRRGQLVLSGRRADPPSAEAYAYLRGDRQSPAHALRLRLRP